MVEVISQERWVQAQEGEIHHYDYGNEENYKNSVYVILRDYFNMNPETDFVGKKILESGGGCYPAVSFCGGLKKAVNVEPLYDRFPENIKSRLSNLNVECISVGFEDYKGRSKFDEVWFFNVLQHVKDPCLQIENAKKIADVVRIFEPIDTAINNEHPHSFNMEFFREQFPNAEVKMYHGGSSARFHQANCAYLTWTKNDKKKTSKH
jgi:hypothetical protein